MDAGGIGAIIGIGIMVCLVGTACICDNRAKIKKRLNRFWEPQKAQTQPLLPLVVVKNPILAKKQFRMNRLVPLRK